MKTALEIVIFSNARCILHFCRMKLIHKSAENCEFFANLGHLDLGNTLCKGSTHELTLRLLNITTNCGSFCQVISHVGDKVLSTWFIDTFIKLKFHSLVVITAVCSTAFTSGDDRVTHLLTLLLGPGDHHFEKFILLVCKEFFSMRPHLFRLSSFRNFRLFLGSFLCFAGHCLY